MAAFVYLLCAVTSVFCAGLLLKKAGSARSGLLFWSAISFGILAASNILLFVDLALVPGIDLLLLRNVITFLAVATLLFALIWETE